MWRQGIYSLPRLTQKQKLNLIDILSLLSQYPQNIGIVYKGKPRNYPTGIRQVSHKNSHVIKIARHELGYQGIIIQIFVNWPLKDKRNI